VIYINADHLSDGLYNIKNGKVFKYKAKGGTVRVYDMGEIVRCKACKHWLSDGGAIMFCEHTDIPTDADDFCSWGERSEL